MAYNSLSEALKSTAFEGLSPEAKKVVFDKYSTKDEAYNKLSDGAKQEVQKKYLGSVAQQPEQPATEKSGKAAAQSTAVSGFKEMFGRDESKAGQVSTEDYFNRAMGGAASGAAIGGALGAFTGPGALVTGAVGGVTGALSGLLEAKAEDLGFGSGTQFVAGLVGPGAVGRKLESTLAGAIERNAAKIYGKLAQKTTGIPGIGSITEGLAKRAEGKTPIDTGSIENLFNVKGKVVDPNVSPEEANKVKQMIGQKFEQATGTKIPQGADPISHIYETTGGKINEATAIEPFTNSTFFNRAATVNGKVNPAQVNKYGKIFMDEKGNQLTGQDVINNLKDFKSGAGKFEVTGNQAKEARWAEGSALEKEYNGWLIKNTGQPWQANSRKGFAEVAAAKAKDELPKMFESIGTAQSTRELRQASNDLNSQIWNLSKEPATQKEFISQLAGNLEKMPAKQAQTIWSEIKDNVGKYMVKDTAKFEELNSIFAKGPTKQSLSRARRILMSVSIPAAIDVERNQ